MTEPALVCPHCNQPVYIAGADPWDEPRGQMQYYACPVHGAVGPVRALDESTPDVLPVS